MSKANKKAVKNSAKYRETDAIMRAVNDTMGKTVIVRASKSRYRIKMRIPTSSLAINRLLGGGVCLPRITQVYGPSNVYKSTFLYDLIANAQQMGLRCLHIDSEISADLDWMERCGIDTDALHLVEAGLDEKDGKKRDNLSADEVIDIIRKVLRAEQYDLITIDSWTAFLTEREQEQEVHELVKLMGWGGKFSSMAFKQINAANRGNAAVVFANQERSSINESVMVARGEQTAVQPTGGKAPKFYSSDTLYFYKANADLAATYTNYHTPIKGTVVSRKRFKGWLVGVRVEKTRTTPNDSRELFYKLTKTGIDHIGEIIDLGLRDGLIVNNGSHYKYVDTEGEERKLGHGGDNMRKKLVEDDEMREEIVERIEAKSRDLEALIHDDA